MYHYDVEIWIGPSTFSDSFQPFCQIGVLGTNCIHMEVDGAMDSLSSFEQIQLRP